MSSSSAIKRLSLVQESSQLVINSPAAAAEKKLAEAVFFRSVGIQSNTAVVVL